MTHLGYATQQVWARNLYELCKMKIVGFVLIAFSTQFIHMAPKLFLVLCCLGTVFFQDVRCASEACATTNVNIRTRPSTLSGNIRGVLKKGDCLPYISQSGNWANVVYKTETAWIYKKYLDVKNTDVLLPTASGGGYSCYGDVMKLRPTGASANTSKGLGGITGVEASNRMLDQDFQELNKRKTCYVNAGAESCIHPAVIAAVASRESRGGRLLYSSQGWGDNERAWGIMQCDVNTSGLGEKCQSHHWDSCGHIQQMTRDVLVKNIKRVQRKHPGWTEEQQLQGGVAAYNFGVDDVRTWAGLDRGSTGDDYSNDVIARAQRLIKNYGW